MKNHNLNELERRLAEITQDIIRAYQHLERSSKDYETMSDLEDAGNALLAALSVVHNRKNELKGIWKELEK